MGKLQNLLGQGNATATKAELVELISAVRNHIGEDDFSGIVGFTESEISQLKKLELLDVVNMLSDAYNPSWEKGLDLAGKMWTDVMKSFDVAGQELSKSDAANADFAAELGSIDFATLIGGPLDACVKAQANAAVSTVSFIKEVGFTEQGDKLVMVDFSYDKTVKDENGNDKTENVKIEVPFISLINIPAIRIETCEIDLNVKLNSTYTRDVSDDFSTKVGASGGFWGVKFSVDVAYQRTSSTGIKIEKEYSMGVKVVATNDDLPAGLEKVLGLLGA